MPISSALRTGFKFLGSGEGETVTEEHSEGSTSVNRDADKKDSKSEWVYPNTGEALEGEDSSLEMDSSWRWAVGELDEGESDCGSRSIWMEIWMAGSSSRLCAAGGGRWSSNGKMGCGGITMRIVGC
jgi:hypothetical protein